MALDSISWDNEGIWYGGTYPRTYTASGTIYKGQIVSVTTNGYVIACPTTSVPFGVAIDTVSDGESVSVATVGAIVEVHADGAGLSAGDNVGVAQVSSVDGYATSLSTTAPSGMSAHRIGIALAAISANDTGKILIC